MDFKEAVARYAQSLDLPITEARADAEAIITNMMAEQGCPREFAESTFIEDVEDTDEKEMKEQEARAKKEGLLKVGARANSVDAYGKAHTRVRKANNDKRILISLLNTAINSIAITSIKEEEEHKIDFIYNDVEYTVTLTAHRKKKKG